MILFIWLTQVSVGRRSMSRSFCLKDLLVLNRRQAAVFQFRDGTWLVKNVVHYFQKYISLYYASRIIYSHSSSNHLFLQGTVNGLMVNHSVLPKNQQLPLEHMDKLEFSFGTGTKFAYTFLQFHKAQKRSPSREEGEADRHPLPSADETVKKPSRKSGWDQKKPATYNKGTKVRQDEFFIYFIKTLLSFL